MVFETSIGRYRLDKVVRRGGSGEVWKAYDEVLGRAVALKLLYSEIGKDIDRDRFAREARAAARLSHPHVVATYDVGEWDGRPYLVMEFLDGRTLTDDLKEFGRLPIDDVRVIGAQIASGLEYAHAAGVIHRDVKPDNLVWADDGVLKLVDFGVAWLVDETGPRLTPGGMAMGTYAYLAPESARGDMVSERSDLYSLGCVLYELLTGAPPFTGSAPSVVLAHVQDQVVPPSWHRNGIPPDLEALVLQLLAKEPGDRPDDAGAVRVTLLGVAEDENRAVASAPTRPGLAVPARRHRRRSVFLVAGGAAAAGVVGAALWWGLAPHGQVGADTEALPPERSRPTMTVSDRDPSPERSEVEEKRKPATPDERERMPGSTRKPDVGKDTDTGEHSAGTSGTRADGTAGEGKAAEAPTGRQTTDPSKDPAATGQGKAVDPEDVAADPDEVAADPNEVADDMATSAIPDNSGNGQNGQGNP